MATFKGRDGKEIKIGGREDIKKPKPLRDLMPSVNVGNMVSKGVDNVVKGAKNISKPNTSNPGFFSKLFMGMDKGTRDPNTGELIYSPFAKPGTASYMGPGSGFKAQGIANPIDDLKKIPSLFGAVMSKISSLGDSAAKQSQSSGLPSFYEQAGPDRGQTTMGSNIPSAFYPDAILRTRGMFRPDQSITNAELDNTGMMGDPSLRQYYDTPIRQIPEFGPFSARAMNRAPDRGNVIVTDRPMDNQAQLYDTSNEALLYESPMSNQELLYDMSNPSIKIIPAPLSKPAAPVVLSESDRGSFNMPMTNKRQQEIMAQRAYEDAIASQLEDDYGYRINPFDNTLSSGFDYGGGSFAGAALNTSNPNLYGRGFIPPLSRPKSNQSGFLRRNLIDGNVETMNEGGPTPFEGRKEIVPVQMLDSGPSKKEIAGKIVTKSLANTAEKELVKPTTDYMAKKGKGFLSSMLNKNHGGPIDPRNMTPSEYLEYMKDKEAMSRMGVTMKDPREDYSQAASAVGTAAGTAIGGPVGGTIGSMLGSYLPYLFNKGGNTSGPMAKVKTETFKIDYN